MNIHQLQSLVEIDKCGSISAAAEKLYISQSALSQQIIKLEDELGLKLFIRNTSPVVFTSSGKAFLQMARSVTQEISQGVKIAKDQENSVQGDITVGIASHRTTQTLPRILPGFLKEYPNVHIKLVEKRAHDLEEELMNGGISMAMMVTEFNNPLLAFEPLIKEHLFLAANRNHPICQEIPPAEYDFAYADLSVCGKYPFVLMGKNQRLRTIADFYFTKYGITPQIAIETSTPQLNYRLATEGVGLAFVGEMTVRTIITENEPVLYRLPGEYTSWTTGFAYRKDIYVDKAMRTFMDYSKAILSNLTLGPGQLAVRKTVR